MSTALKLGPHAFRTGADKTFRVALTAGYFPTVPASLHTAATAQDRLRTLQSAPRTGETLGNVVDRFLADLLADRKVDPQQFHADIVAAKQRADLEPLRLQLDGQMHRRLREAWQATITRALSDLLVGLRSELDEIMTATHAATADLDGLALHDVPAIAAATDAQRQALLVLAPLADRYERLRIAQKAALAASSLPVPGGRAGEWLTGDPTWQDTFDRGSHEFRLYPAIPAGDGVDRLLAVAKRQDVWLPSPDELEEADARFRGVEPVPTRTVTSAATGQTTVVPA